MRNKNQRALVLLQSHVERLDGLHVHVVGRFIHHQDVRLLQNQFAVEHPPLFAARQHAHVFPHIVAAKQQPPQGAAQHLFVVAFLRPLTHPVGKVIITVKVGFVVLGKIARVGFFCPLDAALVGLHFAHQHLQQGGFTRAVRADNGQPLSCIQNQVEILNQRFVE